MMSHAAVFTICTTARHTGLLGVFFGLRAAAFFSRNATLPVRAASVRGFVLVPFHTGHGILAVFAFAAGRLGLGGTALVMSAARFRRLAVRHFRAARALCLGCGWSGGSRRLCWVSLGWGCGLRPGKY